MNYVQSRNAFSVSSDLFFGIKTTINFDPTNLKSRNIVSETGSSNVFKPDPPPTVLVCCQLPPSYYYNPFFFTIRFHSKSKVSIFASTCGRSIPFIFSRLKKKSHPFPAILTSTYYFLFVSRDSPW